MAAGASIYKWTTAAPTPPEVTPIAPRATLAPTPTLSRCESLEQQVTEAQTEYAVHFLSEEWKRAGCAPPTPTPRPTRTPRPTSQPTLTEFAKSLERLRNMVRPSTFQRTKINGLLGEYIADESIPSFECLTRPHKDGGGKAGYSCSGNAYTRFPQMENTCLRRTVPRP